MRKTSLPPFSLQTLMLMFFPSKITHPSKTSPFLFLPFCYFKLEPFQSKYPIPLPLARENPLLNMLILHPEPIKLPRQCFTLRPIREGNAHSKDNKEPWATNA